MSKIVSFRSPEFIYEATLEWAFFIGTLAHECMKRSKSGSGESEPAAEAAQRVICLTQGEMYDMNSSVWLGDAQEVKDCRDFRQSTSYGYVRMT